MQEFGLHWAQKAHSIFYRLHQNIYVDEIIITGNDVMRIDDFKLCLQQKFQTKDFVLLHYFLDIEMARSKKSISRGNMFLMCLQRVKS